MSTFTQSQKYSYLQDTIYIRSCAYILLGQYCDSSTEEYTDHGFSIRWNRTLVGNTVEAPCEGTGLNG